MHSGYSFGITYFVFQNYPRIINAPKIGLARPQRFLIDRIMSAMSTVNSE